MRVLRTVLLVLSVLAVGVRPVASQSLIGSGGLGLPVDPVDARGRALGGVGLGLFGPAVLPTDPAAAADLLVPEVSFSLMQSWVDLQGPAVSSAGGARFPLIGAAYPLLGHGIVTLTFGGVLDQRWQVESEREIDLAGVTVPVVDRFSSDGGVSSVRLGFARRINPSLSVGVTAGAYTGDVTKTFSRQFDSLALGTTVPDFTSQGIWRYGGASLALSAQWDLGDVLRTAATVTWSGNLKADPQDDTEGAGAVFHLPMDFRLGVSGALLPAVNLVLGVSYADWKGFDDGPIVGTSTLGYGVGIELEQARILGRQMPIRLGYRREELPFGLAGDAPTESAFTGGVGFNLAQFEQIPLARVDFSMEAGDRSSGPVSESFWRATMTVRVAGN